jgi:hypothetical protein
MISITVLKFISDNQIGYEGAAHLGNSLAHLINLNCLNLNLA